MATHWTPVAMRPTRSGSQWDMADRAGLIRTKEAELVAVGATYVREEHYGADLGHVVLLDPEGNEFCVA